MRGDQRWRPGTGPGVRRLSWQTRARRWLVESALRDLRVRRMALNRIFRQDGAPGVLCLAPFEDHKVFVDPRDDRIAYSILSGRAWQREHLEAALVEAEAAGRLPSQPQTGRVFVDAGANIGLMTLYAMLSGRFQRAVAIEPDPWNRSIMERNLDINGFQDRVTVVGKAVSDRTGKTRLHRDVKNFGAHSLEPGFVMSPDDAAQSVAVERLDVILEENGIAAGDVGFVKIDVEGHEFAALRGMVELLAQQPPVQIEVTFARDGRAESRQLREMFQGYTTVIDLEQAEVATPIALANFEATAMQHELLIV